MIDPPNSTSYVCPQCGARSQSNAGKCWLCLDNQLEPNPFAPTLQENPQASSQPYDSKSKFAFGILLAVCVTLTILLGIGMAVQDPGMLIPFAILVGPAFVITAVRGLVQTGNSGSPSPYKLFLTFLISIAVTALISFALLVAAAILLFIVCLRQLR